jgi:DNA-binding NarL/FixJ family response regulator
VARILLLTGDLLFGSRVQGALAMDGHDLELVPDRERLERALADPERGGAGLLIVDLTDESLQGAAVYAALSAEARAIPSLGFYSHVEPAAREAGEAAGIDQVVPRSRVAREAPVLAERLLAGHRA